MSANDWAATIIESLVVQGVSDFFIAPGSRCTPLVLAAAHHTKTQTYTHFDERGLGFYALGWMQCNKRPAAIIVTSGTAVGNLLPAIMEAHQSRLPLIVLTADRPPELRVSGANQTTNQPHIFEPWTHFNTDLLCEGSAFANELHSLCVHAVFRSKEGPIHLNLMFRGPFTDEALTYPKLTPISYSPSLPVVVEEISFPEKGVILIGRTCEDLSPIYSLSERLGWPIFADFLSQNRTSPHPNCIHFYEEFFTDEIEFVFQFGDRFISKKLLQWLEMKRPEHVLILDHEKYHDPSHTVTRRITASIGAFCNVFSDLSPRENDWLASFQKQDQDYFEQVQTLFENANATEPYFFWSLAQNPALENALLFIGNSMPIRNADHFFHPQKKPQAIFANRGVSGIDGNIATIAGIATNRENPVIGIIGDQAALHDLNSLALLQKCPNCTLIIINNQGGAIFSYLPISSSKHFEEYFFNPHAFDFSSIAQQFHLPYRAITSFEDFPLEPGIIEVCTNKERDQQVLQQIKQRFQDVAQVRI